MVVGKQLPKAAAASVPMPLASSEGRAGKSSPAAAALSMFCREPTTLTTPIGTITETQWDDLLGTNLKAPLFLSQAAAPALTASSGLILNIVDIHGLRPLKGHPVYSPAKAGLVMLTHALARELSPQVRVNAIAPGPVLFPEEGLTEDRKSDIIEKTLLKRRGSPTDIARAALFFVADAPYVTGQVLAVDGGRSTNA